jgi:hypothetical protein
LKCKVLLRKLRRAVAEEDVRNEEEDKRRRKIEAHKTSLVHIRKRTVSTEITVAHQSAVKLALLLAAHFWQLLQ